MNGKASHNEKAQIAESYNKLYAQFSSEEVREVGNYTIQKLIGSGAFGKVYLATHKLTHTKVVLKTGTKSDPNLVREVFYHRQFKHPHITRLYEVVICEGKIWLVLEYCPGRELYEYLLQVRRIPVDETRKLFAQIVGAVYYAHSLNCIHRDLKLENILLDKKRNAKLSDFGFTRECEARSHLETVCGTTVYMAPELIEKKKYDGFKIDIWALGVILYTMLYGGMPFDDEDEVRTQFMIMNDEPKYGEDIPQEAVLLIKRLLNKDPLRRPSALEILNDPFLEPHSLNQIENTDSLVKNTLSQKFFQSKAEKTLLKKLKNLGIDTHALRASVVNKQCDALSGLWEILLEKEKKKESKKYKTRSRSVLRITAESTSRRVSQFMEPISTPQLSRIVSLKSLQTQQDNQNSGNSGNSVSSPEKKRTTFLQKVSKFFKGSKTFDTPPQFSHSRLNSLASLNHHYNDPPLQAQKMNSSQLPVANGEQHPNKLVIKEPTSPLRTANGSLARPRPASMVSQRSVVSQLTAMSDLSQTSLITTELDTPALRPAFMRKPSSENSLKQSRRSLSLISSNSSTSERSSTMNSLYDTTTSPDVRVIQFSRGRRFNESVFPRSARRRKSPLGGIPPSATRFKKSKAFVIEEQEEGESSELATDMDQLEIVAKSSDFEDDDVSERGRKL
jgi:serine/threonine protein kinase